MSITFPENDFTNIFETINEINTFLNSQIEESLNTELIKNLFSNAFYIEKLINGLSARGLKDIFESKLNEYRVANGKPIPLNGCRLERLCDEVMKKIILIEPAIEVITGAIEEYFRLLSSQRLEALVEQLSESRSLFVRLAEATRDVLPLHHVTSSFLVQSWLKLMDSEDDGQQEIRTIMQGMFSDPDSAQTIVGLLSLESTEDVLPIQNIMLDIICEDVKINPLSSTWKTILCSNDISVVINKFPDIFDVISFTLEKMEDFFEFDSTNKMWSSNNSNVMDFPLFLNILKTLFTLRATHYKIKKFICLRKSKGATQLWTFILNELIAMNSL